MADLEIYKQDQVLAFEADSGKGNRWTQGDHRPGRIQC